MKIKLPMLSTKANKLVNPTESFYKEWTKKNFVTTNERLHPSIKRICSKKFFRNRNLMSNKHEKDIDQNSLSFTLKPPSNPKPPPFFDQVYLGRTRLTRIISERSSSVGGGNPYSGKPNDDALSYMEYKNNIQMNKSFSGISNRTVYSRESVKEKNQQKSLYAEPSDKLIKNTTSNLTKKNLKKLSKGRNLVKICSSQSQARSKQRRLDKLRLKYAHMLKQDKALAQNTIKIVDNNPTEKEITKEEVGSNPSCTKEEGGKEEHENRNEDNDEDDKSEGSEKNEQIEEDQASENLSKATKESKLDLILHQLREERQKRKELESVVQELLSRSGISREQLNLDH
ncbi:unnamed protein product [Moneuplotes crassus]|uniref:Uncharacterized protein n=1 Tax=Euplotes crassus TaxID=5936 RepID=A0AAD1UHY8_EUPCR|nr:unnamed protein product [Moneuplotes crassus]